MVIAATLAVAVAVAATLAWNTATAAPSTVATGSVPALAGHDGAAAANDQVRSGSANGSPARPSAPGGRSSTVASAPAVDPDQVSASIEYLRTQYGVSRSEAIRRLDLQAEAATIDRQLQAALPGAYGGLWLDQANGGVLRVAATDPTRVGAALRGLPDAAHIKVSHVARTLSQLNALQASLRGQVSATDGTMAVDVTSNQVVIYQRSGATAAGSTSRTIESYDQAQQKPAQPDSRLQALAAAHPDVVLRQMVLGTERSAPAAATSAGCSPQKCPPPLRGGMRLDVKRTTANTDTDNLDPMWGQCTVGFIVYDTTSQQFYALTAGHCVVGSDKTGVTYTYDDTGNEIGYEVTAYENADASYPTDYALLAIHDPSYWFGNGRNLTRIYCSGPNGQTASCTGTAAHNLVDVYCTNVESTGCSTASIGITGTATYSSTHVGDVVCATGSGNNDPDHGGYISSGAVPGTRCGEVTGVNGGYVTNICSRKGDSGGPLFSEVTHQGYGILNNGTPGNGDCPATNTEWSQYSPVSSSLSALNTKLGTPGRFVLRTTP
jgi:streptogrisin C